MTLLNINNLKTQYRTKEGTIHAVDGANIQLKENEVLGLLGESGCGKTTLAKSIIKLLPDEGSVAGGSIDYKEHDLTELSVKQLKNEIRWQEVSMIPQNAMNGFDPVYTVGEQIVEVIQEHESQISVSEARDRGKELFEELGIDPERIDDYPHQLSGGMAQRAMIALSLAVSPSILLADEPTTGLDMIIQKQILDLMDRLRSEMNISIIMITHDISAAVALCDRIAIMYGGEIVEVADTHKILNDPRHPYTLGLRNAFPSIFDTAEELVSIPGEPFYPLEPEDQCRFADRCPFAIDECWETSPGVMSYGTEHSVKCIRADEKEHIQREAEKTETWHQLENSSEQQEVAPGGED